MAKITSYFTPRMSLEGDSAGGDNELPQENDLLRNNELAGVDSDCDNERNYGVIFTLLYNVIVEVFIET